MPASMIAASQFPAMIDSDIFRLVSAVNSTTCSNIPAVNNSRVYLERNSICSDVHDIAVLPLS
jgi:hypothetical protein